MKKTMMILQCGLMAAIFIAASPASATDQTIWFPYAHESNNLIDATWWGYAGHPLYSNFVDGGDNQIWDDGLHVWDENLPEGNHPNGIAFNDDPWLTYFDQLNLDKEFRLTFYNPTDDTLGDRSASGSLRFSVWLDGVKQTPYSVNCDDAPGNSLLKTDNLPSGWSWESGKAARYYWYDRLGAKKTVTIDSSDFINMGSNSCPRGFYIEVNSPGDLQATIRGEAMSGYETVAPRRGVTTVRTNSLMYHYTGINEDDYPSSANGYVLTLPYFEERHTANIALSEDALERTTYIKVINAHTATDDITVTVYDKDHNLIETEVFENVVRDGVILFSPSQAYGPGEIQVEDGHLVGEGYVKIEGTKPVAIGINGTFGPADSEDNRIQNGQAVGLKVEARN